MLPAIILLAIWMIVPLALTIWYSFQNYNLQIPPPEWGGLINYEFLLTDPDLPRVLKNTLVLVFAPIGVTVVLGTLLALLYDGPFPGRPIARLLVIAPFFVMPTVAALVWKNLILHPVWGLVSWLMKSVGLAPIDWFSTYPMTAIVIIVSWIWTPFTTLILLTSLQSLDREQLEAARMDGARSLATFRYVVLPHLYRPISVVVMLETIFFLAIYAEIYVTTQGGPGTETTNIPFYIFSRALQGFDVGLASAGGLLAVILANIVAFFFIRAIAKQL
ncbi:carbohydrate ABC transporter permease [Bauldia sp.]|uniref:carbohydrate ABC transporter permease n=1 Tax=Bauldia sp. TaxID=2575872 RepID=UPI0025C1A7B1|nr:sugar ABC transporter permease [Bauldia sp.]